MFHLSFSVKPKVDSSSRNREVTAVAGEKFRVEISFEGSPPPNITWSRSDKNGITVEPSNRIAFEVWLGLYFSSFIHV